MAANDIFFHLLASNNCFLLIGFVLCRSHTAYVQENAGLLQKSKGTQV